MPLIFAVFGLIIGVTTGVLFGVRVVNRQQEEEIVELRASLHEQAMRFAEALADVQWLERELQSALAPASGGGAA